MHRRFDYEFKKEFFLGIRIRALYSLWSSDACNFTFLPKEMHVRFSDLYSNTISTYDVKETDRIPKIRFLCAFYKYINRLLLLAAILPPFVLIYVIFCFSCRFVHSLRLPTINFDFVNSKHSIKFMKWFSASQIWILRKLTNASAHSSKSSYWANMIRIWKIHDEKNISCENCMI